jgi:hypothetical protein
VAKLVQGLSGINNVFYDYNMPVKEINIQSDGGYHLTGRFTPL